ncbi:MAG TPA: LemA family protein [Candidatus Polarisedimenticolaceae bacterium]
MKRVLGCGVFGLVFAVVVIAVLGWGIAAYNRIVRQDVAVAQSWSQVESAYQRRLDLIPNLVETVKGAANFERSTLDAVVAARARATQIVLSPEIVNDPAKFREFQQVQGALGSALSRLIATVEAYPELKATANFGTLQEQIEGTENRINVERRRFNEAVGTYNAAIRVFPGSLVAGLFGFGAKAFFESDSGAEKAPQVKF